MSHTITLAKILLLLTAILSSPLAWAEDELCVGAYHSEEQAIQQLNRFRRTFSTREEWQHRAAKTRAQILEKCELTLGDVAQRGPLLPIIHSTRKYDGYRVSSIAIEVLPGFFLYGVTVRARIAVRAILKAWKAPTKIRRHPVPARAWAPAQWRRKVSPEQSATMCDVSSHGRCRFVIRHDRIR